MGFEGCLYSDGEELLLVVAWDMIKAPVVSGVRSKRHGAL